MPNYGTPQAGGITSLSPGDSLYLFNAETPTAPQASIPFARSESQSADDAGSTFQVVCPGTFSCQVQGSNVDSNASYVNLGTAITTSPSAYTDTARFAFYRVNVTALTGGAITVIVQR